MVLPFKNLFLNGMTRFHEFRMNLRESHCLRTAATSSMKHIYEQTYFAFADRDIWS